MRTLDVIGLWAAGQLSGMLSFQVPLSSVPPVHTILLYFGCALALFLFSSLGMYGSWRGRSMLSMFLQCALSWAAVMMCALLFSFLIHHVGSLSRLWMIHWYVVGTLALLLPRAVVYTILRHLREKGLNSKRVMIVGYGPVGREMHDRASSQSWYGYDVKAVYPAEGDKHVPEGVEKVESLADLLQAVKRHQIHEIWITLPLSDQERLRELQFVLRNALVDIRWVPDTLSMQILSNKIISFLGMPALDLNQPVAADMNAIAKDVFDKVFSAVVLFLLLPLFTVIGIAIKLSSPGPVFFRQQRLGLNGRPFMCFKFRSMKLHQEHGVVTQATQNDPRITKIGAFLRRTSLDELPQFINVLLGDMSVVGPRPHALQHNELYQDKLEMYMLRHRVKPGITGWAQIHGYRGETDTVDKMAKRVQFDLHYIKNWSFAMDMKIIVWTAFKGWTGNNAY
jgi:putative colanic acid biosynthesis UDP-glucose lipid carrier transferase